MGRRSYHHGRLREELVQAGVALIAERGVHGFTLRELARRAEVSSAAPYRHFADKDELLAEIAMQGFDKLREALTDAVDGAPDPLTGFRRQAYAFMLLAAERPAHFRVMYRKELLDPERFPQLCEASRDVMGLVQQAIVDAQTAGVLAPFDVRHVALAGLALVYGAARLAADGVIDVEGDPALSEHVAEAVTEVFGKGLVPRRSEVLSKQDTAPLPPRVFGEGEVFGGDDG